MVEIVYDVPYIQQSGKLDCWSASASMLRRRSVGPGSAKLTAPNPDGTRGLVSTSSNIQAFAKSHNFQVVSKIQTHSLSGLSNLLRNGPLLVIGQFTPDPYRPKAPGSYAHSYVIAGVKGNKVLVHDPDPSKGSGWKNYSDLMNKQPYRALVVLQPRDTHIGGVKGSQPRRTLSSGISTKISGSSLLRRGSRGVEVMDIQKRLGLKPDGIYGPKTHAAVSNYQRSNGLRVDGIVGPQTRRSLTSGVSLTRQFTSGSSLLRRGSRGSEVMDIQKRLGLKPDGIYGPKTHAAVSNFQRRNGLRVDGIVGPQTRKTLIGSSLMSQQELSPLGSSSLLRRGSHGAEVMDIQRRLGLKPDGIFGPKTHSAVMDFQRRNGLRVDGIVGPQTRNYFNDPLRMAAGQLR